ncbi:uncharacterized protein LOC143020001 [Oratosquilla oratoria]|uniref:uncharacterized protein LOC143020001 n=1 Tax=Oratosquilla oratoria TaxID=337810 RepID=UPI003F75B2A8
MGASQSTRKITLINDDKAGVIKLSESLAHRLRGQLEGQQTAATAAVETGSQETQEPQQDVAAAPSVPSLPSAPAPPVASPEPVFPSQVPLETPTFSEPFIPAVAPDVPADAAKTSVPEEPSTAAKPVVEEPATATFEVPPPPPQEPVTTPPPEIILEQPNLGLPVEIEVATTEVITPPVVETPSVPSEDVAPAAVSVPAIAESIAEAMVQGSADVPPQTPPTPVPPPPAPVAAALASVAAAVAPAPDVGAAAVAPVPDVGAAAVAPVPDVGAAIQAGPKPTLTHPSGSIPPWSIYAEEAHLLVMRLREEKEQELQAAEKTWREKLDKREEEFTNIGKLTQEQFSSSLKEVESLFLKATCTPVCQDHQDEVMKCYQDNPKQSLRCSREVAQFTQCVDLTRLQAVMKQHTS